HVHEDNGLLVFKGVTVNGGERVGIVGRTSAGKSSVTIALLRIIEAAEGSILIDGLDISTFGLHELRSHLTIIPQDPFLFGDSIRVCLDPFNKHTDAKVWAALESALLKSYVQTVPEGITTTIVHRINTIMDNGRILVLEQGQITEYDTPQSLLQKKDSIFNSIAAKSGNAK
ncbi:hypothetical protein BGX26_005973, partial [Mortierella sp. AD094]